MKKWFLLAFALSLAANIYLAYFRSTSKSPGDGTRYPPFLKQNRPLSCENENLDTATLPLCPNGAGLKILPSYYPLHSIFIGYEKGYERTGFFQSLMATLAKMPQRVPLVVLTPRDQMDSTQLEVGSYLNEQNSNSVRFLATPSKYSVWAQDYFEQAIDTTTGQPYIFDLPYDSQIGEHIPAAVALACNSNMIGQTGVDLRNRKNFSGNFGGNIEALTDELLLIGQNMAPEQKEVLRKSLSQKLLEINVDWLDVGHVDEVISIVPFPGRSNCPFDILYASPGRALEIIKTKGATTAPSPMTLKTADGSPPSKFNLWGCYANESTTSGCKALKAMNQAYESIMKRNMATILRALTQQKLNCTNTNFKQIPVLFTSSVARGNYGRSDDRAIALDANPVNNVIMGEHIFLPQQSLVPFQEYTSQIMKKYDLNVHYLEGDYIQRFGGGVHCAVNMRRTCRAHP